MEKDNFVIIDSNSIIHRAFHALPPLTTKDGRVVNAVYGFLLVLFKLLKELEPKYLVACFDVPQPTLRKQMFEEYKAQRKKAPDELYAQIPVVKDVLKVFNVPVFEKAGYEGDDLIGTIAAMNKDSKGIKSIIVSGDLDNLQSVNENTFVYFLTKGVKNTLLYDVELVKQKYDGLMPQQLIDYKGLRGDVSDNIPGVKGIGEKTAIKLLKEYKSIDNLYKSLESGKAEDIPQKVREKLLTSKDKAFLSRTLSEIITNVPIEIILKDCEWGGFDLKKVIKMLESFNFYSLVKNLTEGDNKIIGQNLKLL